MSTKIEEAVKCWTAKRNAALDMDVMDLDKKVDGGAALAVDESAVSHSTVGNRDNKTKHSLRSQPN